MLSRKFPSQPSSASQIPHRPRRPFSTWPSCAETSCCPLWSKRSMTAFKALPSPIDTHPCSAAWSKCPASSSHSIRTTKPKPSFICCLYWMRCCPAWTQMTPTKRCWPSSSYPMSSTASPFAIAHLHSAYAPIWRTMSGISSSKPANSRTLYTSFLTSSSAT